MGFFDKFRKKKVEEGLKKNLRAVLQIPISNIMSKYVISIQTHDTLQHAAQVIVGEKVSCVVVKDGDRPIGVITERDFLNKAPVERKELESKSANLIMSPKLITINPRQTISEAVEILIKYHFRKLVVEDSDGRMIGIVTQTDFVRLFDKFYNDLNVKTPDLVNVADVMTRKVVTVDKMKKFTEAKKIMAENHISSIIVTDGEKLAGIITEYDVVAEMVDETNRCAVCEVGEAMTTPVITINENINLFEANRLMITNNVRRLPVTEGEKLIGIVTQTDMCQSIFKFLKVSLEHAEKGELQWEKLEKRTIEKRLV